MKKNLSLGETTLYVGRGAGYELQQALGEAAHSIRVVSPYLSADKVNLLLDKKAQGVSVQLVTSSDFAQNQRFAKIVRQLVDQKQHVNEKAIQRRKNLRVSALLLFLLAVVLVVFDVMRTPEIFPLNFGKPMILGVVSFLSALAVRKIAGNIRVYNYTYRLPLDTTVIVTNTDRNRHDKSAYLPHAKIYIIDGRVAYLGSLNLTTSAFRFNYESLVRIDSKPAIEQLKEEFSYLQSNDRTTYLDLLPLGRKFYKEQKN